MSRSYRRAPGRANVGGFRLDVTVEDKAVRLALRKMRKHAAADAKTTMVGVLGRNMPVIKSGVPAGTPRQGHVRDRLVARARAGKFPYITAVGRGRGQLGILEYGGVRRDEVMSKRHRGRVLWSGERRHPRRMYVTKSMERNTPGLQADILEAMIPVLQAYIDAAGGFKGKAR